MTGKNRDHSRIAAEPEKNSPEGAAPAKRRFAAVFAAAALVLTILAGCAVPFGTGGARSGEAHTPEITLYYINKDKTALMPVGYDPENASSAARVDELIGKLSDAGETAASAPAAGFDVVGRTINNGALTLDVSADYRLLESTDEILVRAAIVNTLCQVKGIKTVSFTVEGEPLLGENGNPVGSMTPEMFVFNLGKDVNAYEKAKLQLYFANEEGTGLIKVGRTVIYNSNIAMEKLVVEELLKGPNSEEFYPTLNPETRILSVTARDGVCYVNLDSAFLTEPYAVRPDVAVYSLVNSLTELKNVNKMQLSIDGDTTAVFLETMSLRTVYERNLSLLEN